MDDINKTIQDYINIASDMETILTDALESKNEEVLSALKEINYRTFIEVDDLDFIDPRMWDKKAMIMNEDKRVFEVLDEIQVRDYIAANELDLIKKLDKMGYFIGKKEYHLYNFKNKTKDYYIKDIVKKHRIYINNTRYEKREYYHKMGCCWDYEVKAFYTTDPEIAKKIASKADILNPYVDTVYYKVSFEDKDIIRNYGAKWDKDRKLWKSNDKIIIERIGNAFEKVNLNS